MKDSLLRKLQQLAERRDEIDALLAAPEISGQQERFRALSRERAGLTRLRITSESSIKGSSRCLELRLAISTVGRIASIGPGVW